jgi:hypothetical protein
MDLLWRKPEVIWTVLGTPWFRVMAITVGYALLDQLIFSAFHNPEVPLKWAKARRRTEYRTYQRRNFNHFTRTLLALASSLFFLIALRGDVSWIDPLYRNGTQPIPTSVAHLVAYYFEFQLARIIFEMFITVDAGLVSVMTGIVRGMHVVVPMLLLMMARLRGGMGSAVHLAFIVQMDLVQVLVDSKGTGKARLLPWWLISVLWFFVRLAAPAYALYKGSFGRFTGRGAYATIIFFQFILWLALPGRKSAPDTRRNPRDERLSRRRRD